MTPGPLVSPCRTCHPANVWPTPPNARAGDLWDSFESRIGAALRSVLHRHESELDFAATAMTPDDVARVLFNGTKGIAAHTPSQREARRQMARLVGLTVRALSPAR